MANAPQTHNGKQKVYEETFVSPEKDSESSALLTLRNIRMCHSSDSGWVDLSGYVEKLPNGKWHAVRHHAKYS